MWIPISPKIAVRCATTIATLLLLIPFSTTACEWDYLIWQVHSKSADPFYRFVQNGKAGYIDRTGKVVITPRFSAYGNGGDEFHDGLLEIDVSAGQYVDVAGKLVFDKGHGWEFSEGLAAKFDDGHKKWGYIDRSGEFVISPRFDAYPRGSISSFSDGLAEIEVGKKYGYIDHAGQFGIQPRFQACDGLPRRHGMCGGRGPMSLCRQRALHGLSEAR